MELEKRQPKVSLFWPTWFSPIPTRLRLEIAEGLKKETAAKKAAVKARKAKKAKAK